MPNNLQSTSTGDVSSDFPSSDIANDQILSAGNLSLVDIPLIAGENADDLERFRVSAMDAIKPRDAIEAIWLQDFICYTWESLRLRRQRTNTIINDRARVLYNMFVMSSSGDSAGRLTAELLAGLPIELPAGFPVEAAANITADAFDADYTDQLTKRWAAGDTDAKQEVDQFLKDQHISEDTITAKTFQSNLERIAQFDKLISHYDHRRDTAIKELEKRRDTLARRAYVFAQTFNDADFEDDESA